MHNAPSVTYPVGRSPFLGWLLAALWLGGAVATAWSWRISGPGGGWRGALSCGALLLAALAAYRFWRAMPAGALRWNGQAWQGPDAAAVSARLSVHLDLQRHLLVRLQAASMPDQWLWLQAASDPARWGDLRRAVYSPATPDPRRDAAQP